MPSFKIFSKSGGFLISPVKATSPTAKVLFINPLVREEDDPRHVPYGIALLASIIMEKGHSIQVFDQNAWRTSDGVLKQVLRADEWDVIALGGITTAYGSLKHIIKMAQLRPRTLIIYCSTTKISKKYIYSFES